MTVVYALAAFLACFAAVMILAEVALDATSLLREWARER